MGDGMSNLDGYLTQSDDVLRDPLVIDDRVRADALITLNLSENHTIHVGSPEYMEVIGQIATIGSTPDGKFWIVGLNELEFPVLIPNDPTVWIDFA